MTQILPTSRHRLAATVFGLAALLLPLVAVPAAAPAGAANEVPALKVVRIADDGTFDRVVFEFNGDVVPGGTLIDVKPNDGSLTFDPSGLPVTISGARTATVRMSPAIATYAASNPTVVYTGPTTFSPTVTANIVQVMQIGDFESVLQWAIGYRTNTSVTVFTLTNPPRVVVDVQHAAATPATPVTQTPAVTG